MEGAGREIQKEGKGRITVKMSEKVTRIQSINYLTKNACNSGKLRPIGCEPLI